MRAGPFAFPERLRRRGAPVLRCPALPPPPHPVPRAPCRRAPLPPPPRPLPQLSPANDPVVAK